MTKDDADQIIKLGFNHPLVRTVVRLDREIGEVKGELKWVKIVTGATFAAVVGQVIIALF